MIVSCRFGKRASAGGSVTHMFAGDGFLNAEITVTGSAVAAEVTDKKGPAIQERGLLQLVNESNLWAYLVDN